MEGTRGGGARPSPHNNFRFAELMKSCVSCDTHVAIIDKALYAQYNFFQTSLY